MLVRRKVLRFDLVTRDVGTGSDVRQSGVVPWGVG